MSHAQPRQGSGITRKQRSLVIITIIFLTYIAIGALTHSLMMSLSFVDGLFFTVVTTLAIGFGDIVPITAAQRVVVCLYGVVGIIILGAAVRLTSVAVLEGIQVGYRRRLRDFKRRRRERKRERELVRRWRAAVEERLVERGLEVWTPDKPVQPLLPSSNMRRSPNVRPSTLRRGSNFVSQAMYLNTEALPPDVLEAAAREAGVPPEKFIGRKFGRRARHNPPQHHHHQQRQDKGSERPGRVPLDYTWTIDDGAMHGQKSGIWGGAWWDRARQAMSSTNAGDKAPDAQDSDGKMTQQKMVKVLEKDERRSLYIKVRHFLARQYDNED
jgi:Ion channel